MSQNSTGGSRNIQKRPNHVTRYLQKTNKRTDKKTPQNTDEKLCEASSHSPFTGTTRNFQMCHSTELLELACCYGPIGASAASQAAAGTHQKEQLLQLWGHHDTQK